MRFWRQILCTAVVAALSVSTVYADPVAAFLAEKGSKELPMSAARISTGAQFENNVVLFVQPESQAMWKAPEAMEGYVYMMVRSGMEGTGMDMIVPQIMYEVKIDGKLVEMKAVNNPSTLRVMVGSPGVYTSWIRSFEPVKIAKDATIIVTSWVEWGVACILTVSPLEVAEPMPRVAKAAPRAADQVFAGQSADAAQDANDLPDRVLEKAQPYYLAPKDIQENAEVKMNKNQLDFAKNDATAAWIVQDNAEGYLFLKVTAGAAEGDAKFIKPDIQYDVTIDGHAVPMKRLKSNAMAEEARYKMDQPSGWIRSEQMIRLTPGCAVNIKAKQAKTSVYQTVISAKNLTVE